MQKRFIFVTIIIALHHLSIGFADHIDRSLTRPTADHCVPIEREAFTFQPFSEGIRDLKSKDPKKLTLAITAGVEDKKKVEAFIADLGNQLAIQDRTKAGKGIIQAAFKDVSELFKPTPSLKDRAAPKLFSPEEIQFMLFADTRSEYQAELKKGWEEFERVKQLAREKGRAEGIRQGTATIREAGFFTRAGNFLSFGSLEGIAARTGARRGAAQGEQIADLIGPPTVVAKAEEEIMKQTEDLQKYVDDYIKTLGEEGKRPSVSFSTLIYGNDFSHNVLSKDESSIHWANSFVDDDKKLDIETAKNTHRKFLSKMNEARTVLKKVFHTEAPGFRIAIISPQGRVLEVIDPKKASVSSIAAKYFKHKERCAANE